VVVGGGTVDVDVTLVLVLVLASVVGAGVARDERSSEQLRATSTAITRTATRLRDIRVNVPRCQVERRGLRAALASSITAPGAR